MESQYGPGRGKSQTGLELLHWLPPLLLWHHLSKPPSGILQYAGKPMVPRDIFQLCDHWILSGEDLPARNMSLTRPGKKVLYLSSANTTHRCDIWAHLFTDNYTEIHSAYTSLPIYIYITIHCIVIYIYTYMMCIYIYTCIIYTLILVCYILYIYMLILIHSYIMLHIWVCLKMWYIRTKLALGRLEAHGASEPRVSLHGLRLSGAEWDDSQGLVKCVDPYGSSCTFLGSGTGVYNLL